MTRRGADRPVAFIAIGLLLLIAGLVLWYFHEALDRPLGSAIYAGTAYRHLDAVIVVTRLGGAAAMIPLGLLCVIALLVKRRLFAAAWLFCMIASGRVAVELLKWIVGRTRPDETGHLVEVASASFPSSHAAGSMLTMAAIILAFRPGTIVMALLLSWSLLVGISRILLGVHWPSDVLAGWGFGMAWIGCAATLGSARGRAWC